MTSFSLGVSELLARCITAIQRSRSTLNGFRTTIISPWPAQRPRGSCGSGTSRRRPSRGGVPGPSVDQPRPPALLQLSLLVLPLPGGGDLAPAALLSEGGGRSALRSALAPVTAGLN